jgi:hypothetical protein
MKKRKRIWDQYKSEKKQLIPKSGVLSSFCFSREPPVFVPTSFKNLRKTSVPIQENSFNLTAL